MENFVDARVGDAMPTGSYDRGTGRWVASPDGRVIKVLSEAGGLAAVDLDGDGAAETSQALTAFGITGDELRQLSTLYAPGQELVRVLVPHFSPWDHNNGVGLPPGARAPQLKEFVWRDPNDPCKN